MGMSVGLRIEGEPSEPSDMGGAGKLLFDVVGWAGDARQADMLRLSQATRNALLRVDASAFGREEETDEALQDPTALAAALGEVREALRRVSGAGRLERHRYAFIRRTSLEEYDDALNAAVRVCDDARARGRRVALTAW